MKQTYPKTFSGFKSDIHQLMKNWEAYLAFLWGNIPYSSTLLKKKKLGIFITFDDSKHLYPLKKFLLWKISKFFWFLLLFGRLVMYESATPWTAAHQASLSFTISWSLVKLMSIELMMPFNHLILCCPLLLLPSIFPSNRVFFNASALLIRWPKYWSYSISSSNEYFRVDFLWDWLLWSHCSPRDSQESSPTPQFKSINSLALSLLHSPTLTSIHDYW